MNYHQALKILELPDPPNPGEIKQAFRLLALKYHPDRNPNSPSSVARFREVMEAYNYLVVHIQSIRKRKPPPASPVPPIEDLDDIFDDIFGFTRNDRVLGFQESQDLYLTLQEVAFGTVKTARISAFEKCLACKGSGAEKNTHATICTHCFGSGQIRIDQAAENDQKICPKCQGRGRLVRQACLACNGFGRIKKYRRQSISIPQGLLPNQCYTLNSQDVHSQKSYQLFVRLLLKPHPLFAVENSDILCEYPVSDSLAKNGGTLDFPGLWGWSHLVVAPQSQTGDLVYLKGGGMWKNASKSDRGDFCVSLLVTSDRKYRKKARTFLKQVSLDNRAYGREAPWWQKILSRFH